MPALTPSFLMDLESEMEHIQENEYARLSENLFWSDLAVVRPASGRRKLLSWFFKTALIEDLGVKGGKMVFDDLVSKYTEIEARYAGNGLKLTRQQFEDTDGDGVDLAAEWAAQTAAETAYWPQSKIVELIQAGETGIGYDGVAYFAKNHPVLPGDPSMTYANLFSGAADSTPITDPGDADYPGAVALSATDATAIDQLKDIRTYISTIRMPDKKRPRRLRPLDFYAPPQMAPRLVSLTQTKFIAKDNGSTDMEPLIEHLAFGRVIEVDEFQNDPTSFYITASTIGSSALGALARIEREPFSTRYFGVMDDVELSRMEELEWHHKGRDGYGYGHPFLLFKVKAT
jgi:hypothetical protein